MPMIRESGKDSPDGRVEERVPQCRSATAEPGHLWRRVVGRASGARRHEDVKGDCVNLLENLAPYPCSTGVGEP